MRRANAGTVVLCLLGLFMAATPGISAAQADPVGGNTASANTLVTRPIAGAVPGTVQDNQPMACYEGRIPGSSNWDGDISTHVHGSACKTRWGQLVWDDNPSCCVPMWVKIDRQLNGTYGWLTTHTKYKKVLWGNFGTHNTATVPWVQYADQRFHACWGVGTSQPTSWNCGPWVN